MVKNRDQAMGIGELSQGEPSWSTAESERTTYLQHVDHSVAYEVTLHELFGYCKSHDKISRLVLTVVQTLMLLPSTMASLHTWTSIGCGFERLLAR